MPLSATPIDDALAVMRGPGALDETQFDRLARSLHEQQAGRIAAYGAWCRYELAARPSPYVSDWRSIPALPIAAFKQFNIASSSEQVVATWESSGTTSDVRSLHRLGGLAHYEASIDAGVASALLPDVVAGDLAPLACVQLQPSSATISTSSLTHMFDRIRTGPWCTDEGVFVDATWRVEAELVWSRLEALAAAHRPVLLLATSLALATLLERAHELGWDNVHLPAGSRVVDTGGYKGRARELTREELLGHIERQLGVSRDWCENEFGMSELSSQAWLGTVAEAVGRPVTLPASGARWTPPWMRVRVVDPITLDEVPHGEQGLLVFHDLANVWSCAAIRTEDVGIRRGEGFELVGRAPDAALKGCSLRLEELDS